MLSVSTETKLLQEMDGLSSPSDSRAVAVGNEVFASGLVNG